MNRQREIIHINRQYNLERNILLSVTTWMELEDKILMEVKHRMQHLTNMQSTGKSVLKSQNVVTTNGKTSGQDGGKDGSQRIKHFSYLGGTVFN